MKTLHDILQSLELGQVSTSQAQDAIKQSINYLIDLKDKEVDNYDHFEPYMRDMCKSARRHGLELAIDKMRRDFLDDWNCDYPKYEIGEETVNVQ